MRHDFYGPHFRPTPGSVTLALIVLIVAAPVLLRLVAALIPYLVLTAVVAGALRLIWFYTDRW